MRLFCVSKSKVALIGADTQKSVWVNNYIGNISKTRGWFQKNKDRQWEKGYVCGKDIAGYLLGWCGKSYRYRSDPAFSLLPVSSG